MISRFDYQPDICKDYKETGRCGYGDSCKVSVETLRVTVRDRSASSRCPTGSCSLMRIICAASPNWRRAFPLVDLWPAPFSRSARQSSELEPHSVVCVAAPLCFLCSSCTIAVIIWLAGKWRRIGTKRRRQSASGRCRVWVKRRRRISRSKPMRSCRGLVSSAESRSLIPSLRSQFCSLRMSAIRVSVCARVNRELSLTVLSACALVAQMQALLLREM